MPLPAGQTQWHSPLLSMDLPQQPAHPPYAQPQRPELVQFLPSPAWAGMRPGYVFTTRAQGTGYYVDAAGGAGRAVIRVRARGAAWALLGGHHQGEGTACCMGTAGRVSRAVIRVRGNWGEGGAAGREWGAEGWVPPRPYSHPHPHSHWPGSLTCTTCARAWEHDLHHMRKGYCCSAAAAAACTCFQQL